MRRSPPPPTRPPRWSSSRVPRAGRARVERRPPPGWRRTRADPALSAPRAARSYSTPRPTVPPRRWLRRGTAMDNAGNPSAAVSCNYFVTEHTPPVVVLTCPTADVLLGSDAVATWVATDEAGGSGLAGASSGSIELDTSAYGPAHRGGSRRYRRRQRRQRIGRGRVRLLRDRAHAPGRRIRRFGAYSCPAAPLILGSAAEVHWTAYDPTPGSGIADGYPTSGSITLDTSSVGVQHRHGRGRHGAGQRGQRIARRRVRLLGRVRLRRVLPPGRHGRRRELGQGRQRRADQVQPARRPGARHRRRRFADDHVHRVHGRRAVDADRGDRHRRRQHASPTTRSPTSTSTCGRR